LVTKDNEPNMHNWCATPFLEAVTECAAGNLTKGLLR